MWMLLKKAPLAEYVQSYPPDFTCDYKWATCGRPPRLGSLLIACMQGTGGQRAANRAVVFFFLLFLLFVLLAHFCQLEGFFLSRIRSRALAFVFATRILANWWQLIIKRVIDNSSCVKF
jgi:hypothetical protein